MCERTATLCRHLRHSSLHASPVLTSHILCAQAVLEAMSAEHRRLGDFAACFTIFIETARDSVALRRRSYGGQVQHRRRRDAALALRRRLRGSIVDPPSTRCDLGAPPPRGRSVPAHPSSTLLDIPLISPLHSEPLSHTTSHPLCLPRRLSAASWTACPPPALLSHVGCVWSCVGPKRAPGAEFCAASADGVGFGQSCRMYVRVSSCSCVLSVSCDERACPRCVPVHGRRKFASMYVN